MKPHTVKPALARLPRRTLLRGMGLGSICLGLPVLDAMLDDNGSLVSRAGAQVPAPLNFLTFFIPCGTNAREFWPLEEAENYAMSRCLQPIAHLRGEFALLKRLYKEEAGRNQDIDNDAHVRGHASFATGGSLGGQRTVEFPSADQIAALALGGDTKFRSLPVALTGIRSPAQQADHISWSTKDTYAPADNDPLVLFNRVFGDPNGGPNVARPLAQYKKSIFDYLRTDIEDLNTRVGTSDRRKLDQFLGSIRDVEKQLEPSRFQVSCAAPTGIDPRLGGPAPSSDRGTGAYSNERAQLLIWLQVTAVACGLTRFGSFMLAGRSNKRQFNWLGIPNADDGHHGISHDASPAGLEQQSLIVEDEMKQFAYMLNLMQSIQQGDHSLLYNSVVFFANEHGEGADHDFSNTPVILAGRAGGQLKTGQQVVFENATMYSRVFLNIFGWLGMNVTTFGAFGTSPLPRLSV